MKIKTKRGPRRTRNQRVVSKRFVITDYDECYSFEANKPYKVIEIEQDGYMTIKYMTDEIFCAPVGRPCCHLNRIGTWQYLTK